MGVRRAPVGHVHRVEGGLEQLVLEQEALIVAEPCVDLGQCLGEAILTGDDVVLAGIVGAIGEPQLEVARPGRVHDVDAVEQVVGGLAPDPGVGVGHRPEHVVVVLEHVGVDDADADTLVGRVLGEVAVVVDAIPRDVQRDARRHAGEPVHLRRVGDLLVRVARHALLGEHLEARPGVAERP